MLRNSRLGTYRPSTARHAVSGVDNTSPSGPHNHVQNAAATSSATSDTPTLWPYNHGSTTLEITSSRHKNKPNTSSGGVKPGKTATLNTSGNAHATHAPTYGMYRKQVPRNPHKAG